MPSDHSPSPELLLRPSLLLLDGQAVEGHEVCIQAGRIAAIRKTVSPVNLPDRLLMPGFVNAHSHAFQRGIRGFVQHAVGKDDFWAWREQMYRLASSLSPEGIRDLSALAYLEMLQAGFTSVGEFHYLHHQPNGQPYDNRLELGLRVAEAASEVGLELCLIRVAYSRAGAGKKALEEQLRFCDSDMEQVLLDVEALSRVGGFSVGLSAHSVRALSLEQLSALAQYGGIVHAHVNEQPAEIEQCLAEHGCRPLELFEKAGLLSDRFSAVHFTHPSDHEVALLREAQGGVVACPTTEMDLGDGFLPIEVLKGIALSVGTDSHARIDPLAEIRALEWHARARLQRRCVTHASDDPEALSANLLSIGSEGGARALGLNTGRMVEGSRADLIAVDATHTSLCTGPILTNLVFAGQPSMVQEAWVGGVQRLWEGHHPLADSIRRRAAAHL